VTTRRRRLWGRALQVALGLALGAGLVEAAFHVRDGGAFPHLNLYRSDPRLGVRLRPHASQGFALGKNPPSKIHINGAGLRGAELPPPGPGEILVLGDSQVFGLGVDDDQTFSARLAKRTGRTVINAGVPTYGPPEYNALAAELIAARKPATVVLAVNMLNDLFEADRPNRERHRVWDGWAVRSETAPPAVTEFPGRAWLFGRSHAVYALRRWLHEREGTRLPDGLPSEGQSRDLLGEATRRALRNDAAEAARREREAQLQKADQQLNRAQEALGEAQTESDESWEARNARYIIRRNTALATAHPGDIVREEYSEEARSVRATADQIREAARLRDQAMASLAKLQAEEDEALASSLQQRNTARARVRALSAQLRAAPRPQSVLLPRLRELQALCAKSGAEAVVVALPIDVQVSSSEWRKYGLPPSDMSATLALTEDLLASARALGMRALDARPALLAALPGAFLHGDIHLTAKGHVAVAGALAATLAQPAPDPQPEPGLPAGRSHPPFTIEQVESADPLVLAAAESASCALWVLDEWLVAHCGYLDEGGDRALDVTVLESSRGEVLTFRSEFISRVRAPLLPGDKLAVRFDRENDSQVMRAERKQDGAFAITFDPRVPGKHEPPQPPAAPLGPPALCKCEGYDPCTDWYEPEPRDCAQAFPDDCQMLERCILGDPKAWPTCAPGSVHADPSGRCLPLCGKGGRCASGKCEPWQGVNVCRPPT
jgi:hypothetical protein